MLLNCYYNVSTLIPGPMLLEIVADFIYTPLTAAGLNLTN